MQMVPLSSSARSKDVSGWSLVRSGSVPCVVYGNEVKNTSLSCRAADLTKAYVKAGESTLIELEVGQTKVPVIFHEVQFDPVDGNIIHADFYAVNMKKEIEARVPIAFEGEAPAIKELGGVLVTPHDHVTVLCLPADLPHEIPVSLASLAEFGSALSVRDLSVPKGVRIQEKDDVVIATIQEPRKEEEVVAPVAAAVEGAEGAEGAVSAGGAEGAVTAASDGGAAEVKAEKKEKKEK